MFSYYTVAVLALLVLAELSLIAMALQSPISRADRTVSCIVVAFYCVTGMSFALATVLIPLTEATPASIFALSAWGVLCLFIALLAVLDFFARKVLARCINNLQSHVAVHDEDGDVCPHQGCLDTMKKLRDDRIITFSRIGFAAKELFGPKHEVSESEVGEEVHQGSFHEKTSV